jgi:hypothetical protein
MSRLVPLCMASFVGIHSFAAAAMMVNRLLLVFYSSRLYVKEFLLLNGAIS